MGSLSNENVKVIKNGGFSVSGFTKFMLLTIVVAAVLILASVGGAFAAGDENLTDTVNNAQKEYQDLHNGSTSGLEGVEAMAEQYATPSEGAEASSNYEKLDLTAEQQALIDQDRQNSSLAQKNLGESLKAGINPNDFDGFDMTWQHNGQTINNDPAWAHSAVKYAEIDESGDTPTSKRIDAYCKEDIYRDVARSDIKNNNTSQFNCWANFQSRFFYDTCYRAPDPNKPSEYKCYSFYSCALVFYNSSNPEYNPYILEVSDFSIYSNNDNGDLGNYNLWYKNNWGVKYSFQDERLSNYLTDGRNKMFVFIVFKDVTSLITDDKTSPAFTARWTNDSDKSSATDPSLPVQFMFKLEEKDKKGAYADKDYAPMAPQYTGIMDFKNPNRQVNYGDSSWDEYVFDAASFATHYAEMMIPDDTVEGIGYRQQAMIKKELWFYQEPISGGKGDWIPNVQGVHWNGSKWAYSVNRSTTAVDPSQFKVAACVVYGYSSTEVTEPLDNDEAGIKVNMFDYDSWCANGIDNNQFSRSVSMSKGQELMFVNGKYGKEAQNGGDINRWTGSLDGRSQDYTGWLKTGIVKNKLGNDGYPEVNSGSSYNHSLAAFFNPKENASATDDNSGKSVYKHDYIGLTGLFDKKYYEDTGYYIYGSNPLKLNDAGKTYNYPGHFAQVRYRSDQACEYDVDKAFQRDAFVLYTSPMAGAATGVGKNFMPWNLKNDDVNTEWNCDYHFGMSMETSFLMPNEGEVFNAKSGLPGPMVYYFDGDDDLWMFTDDFLTLDTGGIKNQCRGTVNYQRGLVTTFENCTDRERDIYGKISYYWMDDMYLKASGQEGDHDENWWKQRGWERADWYTYTYSNGLLGASYERQKHDASDHGSVGDGNKVHYRLKSWSTHEMKMYYFERGGDATNCVLAFNLQTIPAGTALVGKAPITTPTGSIVDPTLNDQDFYYQVDVHKWDLEHSQYKGDPVPYGQAPDDPDFAEEYGGVTYAVYWMDAGGSTGTPVEGRQYEKPDEYGRIHIKPNQIAMLHGYLTGAEYKIGEIDKPSSGTTPGKYDVIDAQYDIKIMFPKESTTATEDAEQMTFYDDRGKGLGTDDIRGGAFTDSTNLVVFVNTPDNLFDLRIKKRGDNDAESDLKLQFKNKVNSSTGVVEFQPYANASYDIFDADDDPVDTNPHTTDANGKITLEDGQYAVIHNVAMGMENIVTPVCRDGYATKYGIIPYSGDGTDWDDVGPKPIVYKESNPASGAADEDGWTWYNDQEITDSNPMYLQTAIPLITSGLVTEGEDANNYSEIDFIVNALGRDLEISKTISGNDVQEAATYKLSVFFYTDAAATIPYYPDNQPTDGYVATITNGTTEKGTYAAYIMKDEETPATTWIDGGNAGELMLYDNSLEKCVVPQLGQGDKLTVTRIIPDWTADDAPQVYMKVFEEQQTGTWYPTAKINGGTEVDLDNETNAMDYITTATTPAYGPIDVVTQTGNAVASKDAATNTIEITNTFAENDMLITKTVTGGNTEQQNAAYPLSVIMYQQGTSTAFTGDRETYDATITRKGGTTENITVKLLNTGVLVKYTSGATPEESLIELNDGDSILIKYIVPGPKTGTTPLVDYAAWELNCDLDYWHPSAKFNGSSTAVKLNNASTWTVGSDSKVGKQTDAQPSITTGQNKIEILNEFKSQPLQIAKIVQNGTEAQQKAKYALSIMLYKDATCATPFYNEDFEYKFEAVAYMHDQENPDAPVTPVNYTAKLNENGELLFSQNGVTYGLIELGNGDGVAVHNLIPVTDNNTSAVYIKAFEQNVSTGFWKALSRINDTVVENTKALTEPYTFNNIGGAGGIEGLTNPNAEATACKNNEANAVYIYNGFIGNDLVLTKSVNGGTSAQQSVKYKLNVLLAAERPSSDPVTSYSPYINTDIFEATIGTYTGAKTYYDAMVNSNGELLISPKGTVPPVWAIPELYPGQLLTVSKLLSAETPIYMMAWEASSTDKGSGSFNVSYNINRLSTSEDTECKGVGSLDSTSGNVWNLHDTASTAGWINSDPANWVKSDIGSSPLVQTQNTVEVINEYGGNNLVIQKFVTNEPDSYKNYVYAINVLCYQNEGATIPYSPDDPDKEYDTTITYKDGTSSNHLKAKFKSGKDSEGNDITAIHTRSTDAGYSGDLCLGNGEKITIYGIIPVVESECNLFIRTFEESSPRASRGGGPIGAPSNLSRSTLINKFDISLKEPLDKILTYHLSELPGYNFYGYYNTNAGETLNGENNVIVLNEYQNNSLQITKTVQSSGSTPDQYYPILVFLYEKNGTDPVTGEDIYKPVDGSTLGKFKGTYEDGGHEVHGAKMDVYITNMGEIVGCKENAPGGINACQCPMVGKDATLTIENLIPVNAGNPWYIRVFEKNMNGQWVPSCKVTNGSDDPVEDAMSEIYTTPQSNPTLSDVDYQKGQINPNYIPANTTYVSAGPGTIIEVHNKFSDIYGFDVFQNPAIIAGLIVAALMLLSAGPLAFWRIRRRAAAKATAAGASHMSEGLHNN